MHIENVSAHITEGPFALDIPFDWTPYVIGGHEVWSMDFLVPEHNVFDIELDDVEDCLVGISQRYHTPKWKRVPDLLKKIGHPEFIAAPEEKIVLYKIVGPEQALEEIIIPDYSISFSAWKKGYAAAVGQYNEILYHISFAMFGRE